MIGLLYIAGASTAVLWVSADPHGAQKLGALLCPECCPPTRVSRDAAELRAAGKGQLSGSALAELAWTEAQAKQVLTVLKGVRADVEPPRKPVKDSPFAALAALNAEPASSRRKRRPRHLQPRRHRGRDQRAPRIQQPRILRRRKPEPHLQRCRIDHPQRLHPPDQMREFPVDLAHFLAAIKVVAVLGTVAIACRPADDLDNRRTVCFEQLVVSCLQGRHPRRRDGLPLRLHWQA